MNNKNYYIDKVVPFRGKFICSFKKTNGLNKIRESLFLKNSTAAIIRMRLVLETVLYNKLEISVCFHELFSIKLTDFEAVEIYLDHTQINH